MLKLAESFWEKGNQFLKEGKDEKASYYLNLFDDLVGSDDELYEHFHEQDKEALKQIERLRQKPSYMNELEDWISEKGQELTDMQRIQWVTLSLARMNWVFREFSKIKGFESFSVYKSVVNILVEEIRNGYHINLKVDLDDFILDVEDIEDSVFFSTESNIEIAGYGTYEAKDLIGGGIITDMLLTLGSIVDYLKEEEECEIPLRIVVATLHRGFFARVSEEAMQDIDIVEEEKQRIKADFEYIAGNPNTVDYYLKVDEYLTFSWLQKMKIVNEAPEKYQHVLQEISAPLFAMLREINELERKIGKRGQVGIDFNELKENYKKIVWDKCTEKFLGKGYGVGLNVPPKYRYIDDECVVIFNMKDSKKAVIEIHYSSGSLECKHRFKFIKQQETWLIDGFDWYSTYDCVWHRGRI